MPRALHARPDGLDFARSDQVRRADRRGVRDPALSRDRHLRRFDRVPERRRVRGRRHLLHATQRLRAALYLGRRLRGGPALLPRTRRVPDAAAVGQAGRRRVHPLGAAGSQDECLGYCTSSGVCLETCVVGASGSCALDGDAGAASLACVPGAQIVKVLGGGGFGDAGVCATLCDCNADCSSPGYVCIELDPTLASALGRPGYCAIPQKDVAELSCDGGPADAGND